MVTVSNMRIESHLLDELHFLKVDRKQTNSDVVSMLINYYKETKNKEKKLTRDVNNSLERKEAIYPK